MDSAGGSVPRTRSQADAAGAHASTPTDDYRVTVTAESHADGRFVGVLKVVRKRDGRMLYPFTGAPEIGRFATIEEARAAAAEEGRRVVAADLRNPEP